MEEWIAYFKANKYYCAASIWTLFYLGVTPNIAWAPYAAQAKWKKREEDRPGDGNGGGSSSSSSSSSEL